MLSFFSTWQYVFDASLALSPPSDMELVQESVSTPREEVDVEDYSEVLRDGTVHKVHRERRHSLQNITKTWKSQDGEEFVEEHKEEVPGTVHEETTETFEEPPHLVHEEEDEDVVREDGSIMHQKIIKNRMEHHIRVKQKSFDSATGVHFEEYETDEVVPETETTFVERDDDVDSDSDEYFDDGDDDTVEDVGDKLAQSSLGGEDSGAVGDDEEVETHRLMMKKEVHKKTTIGPDGKETTTVHEDSQIQQENEPPEELRDSMQEIINQFMESDPQPAQLPPSESKEEQV